VTGELNERPRPGTVLAATPPGDLVPVVADMTPVVDGEWRLFVAGHTVPAGTYVDRIRESFDDLPSALDVVEIGDGEPTVGPDSLPSGVTVRAAEPADLTAVAVHANEFLTRARDTGDRVFVWYDSITDVLDHVGRSAVFRSLHRLSVRTWGVGGTGYYWLSPDEHDDRTWAVFGSLFDAVVPPERAPG
jgi:hypothetical protein